MEVDSTASSDDSKQQTRVVLWAVPRSISTAFFRAIMEGIGIKVLLEPFSNAYYFGHERVSKRYANEPCRDGCLFNDIKKQYELPYEKYKSVFVKDMAYYLNTDVGNFEHLLPSGYVHTFLIRHPALSVASLYKLSIDKDRTGWDWFNPDEAGFKELYQLFTHITQDLGQKAIVVDSEDLIKSPRDTLVRYCQMTGLEFSEKMLSWKSIDFEIANYQVEEKRKAEEEEQQQEEEEVEEEEQPPISPGVAPKIFKGWQPWFEGVLSSTSFREFDQQKIKKVVNTSVDPEIMAKINKMPPKVSQCVMECLPYYEKMRAYKI